MGKDWRERDRILTMLSHKAQKSTLSLEEFLTLGARYLHLVKSNDWLVSGVLRSCAKNEEWLDLLFEKSNRHEQAICNYLSKKEKHK